MKKKFLTTLLVIVMAFVIIASVGCKPTEKPNNPPDSGVTDGDNTTPGGEQQPGDNNPGGNDPGDNTPGGNEPGENIPDVNEPDESEWDDGVDYSTVYLTDGNGIITGMTDYGMTLTHIVIPVKVGSETVTGIGADAFSGNSKIQRVKFAPTKNQVVISGDAFEDCVNLKSAQLSAGVNSIGLYAFYGCNSLEYLSVDDGNEKYESIGNCIINKETNGLTVGCKSSRIPEKVVEIEPYAFAKQGNIESMNIPSGVKTIGKYAFYYCSSLKTVNLSENLESVGNLAFKGTKIQSIIFPAKTKNIGDQVFQNCSSLNSVTFGEDLESIGVNAFEGTQITAVNLSAKIKSIGNNAFVNCSSLETLTFADNTQLTTIGAYAFKNCVKIKSIKFPQGLEKLTGTQAFMGCTSLEEVIFPDGLTSIAMEYFNNCKALTKVVIPQSVTTLSSKVFLNCKGLTIYCEIASKPSSGWNVNWNSGKLPVVWDCKNNEVDSDGYINYYTQEGAHYRLKDGNAVFAAQPDLFERLEIKSSITYKDVEYTVNEIAVSACENNSKLTYAYIPSSVVKFGPSTNTVAIFKDCKNLKSVEFAANSQITQVGNNSFDGCEKLESIVLPTALEKLGSSCFSGCTSLARINLPSTLKEMGSYVFKNCTSLSNIALPENLWSIGGGTFENCTSITSINLPDKLLTLSTGLFKNCTGLTSIFIPIKVNKAWDDIFVGCTSLSVINVEASEKPSGFSENWNSENVPVNWGASRS